MKICLLGDFTGTPDEGMKNISQTTYTFLAMKNDVKKVNTKDVTKLSVLMQLRTFRPDIVHYLHGPTIRSLIILKFIRLILHRNVKIVVSATRPYFSKSSQDFIPFIKPDLVLTQSEKFENFFKKFGCRVRFFPNAVDCRSFTPADYKAKKRFRTKYNLPENQKTVLHVGHLKENRKLKVLLKVQSLKGFQVVVVGGTGEKTDTLLKETLKRAGVIVIHEYIKNISEIYRAADLYLFPISDVQNKLPESYNEVGAIDLPLSVLEAMACNLPVITTPFGALPRLFKQGGGFEYAFSEDEIINKVKSFTNNGDVNTRDKVRPYDFWTIINNLQIQYAELIGDAPHDSGKSHPDFKYEGIIR